MDQEAVLRCWRIHEVRIDASALDAALALLVDRTPAYEPKAHAQQKAIAEET